MSNVRINRVLVSVVAILLTTNIAFVIQGADARKETRSFRMQLAKEKSATLAMQHEALFQHGVVESYKKDMEDQKVATENLRTQVRTLRASRSRRVALSPVSHSVARPASTLSQKLVLAVRPQMLRSGFSATELRIRSCESGDGHGSYNYRAENSRSTASGAWQFLDSTWDGFGGYHHAASAPPVVQDRKARLTFDASGYSPWNASRSCWG